MKKVISDYFRGDIITAIVLLLLVFGSLSNLVAHAICGVKLPGLVADAYVCGVCLLLCAARYFDGRNGED